MLIFRLLLVYVYRPRTQVASYGRGPDWGQVFVGYFDDRGHILGASRADHSTSQESVFLEDVEQVMFLWMVEVVSFLIWLHLLACADADIVGPDDGTHSTQSISKSSCRHIGRQHEVCIFDAIDLSNRNHCGNHLKKSESDLLKLEEKQIGRTPLAHPCELHILNSPAKIRG